eukprot:ANDGO_05419.mRNA.1 LIMR family protein DDB_G0293610
MLNVWIIVSMCIVALLILIASIYFLVYFSSPDDHNQAWIPKIVVVLGLCFSCFVVLLLPASVANQQSDGGLDLEILWQFVLMSLAALCFVVIPFCIFYYEEQEPEGGCGKQLAGAVMYTFAMLIIVVLFTVLMYLFLGFTEIPYTSYSTAITDTLSSSCVPGAGKGGCGGTSSTLEIRVSIVVYIIAVMAFIGYFLLTLFGGIGLVALPMDMINAYLKRPQKLEPAERARIKVDLQQRATKLIASGKELEARKRSKGGIFDRKGRATYLKYKRAVYFLERDFERLRLIEKEAGGSPWRWWLCLFVGLVGICLSICWLLQILFWMFLNPPFSPFLNLMFIDLDKATSFFGTVFYGIFVFYLLWAIIKGCVKFGLRILCFAIHPMTIGNTLMNSFLFNVSMICFSSVAVVTFSAQAFSVYARFSEGGVLFGVYIRYLKVLTYFWQYYLYFFWAIAGLSFIYLILCPKKRKQEDVDVELIALQGGIGLDKEERDRKRKERAKNAKSAKA